MYVYIHIYIVNYFCEIYPLYFIIDINIYIIENRNTEAIVVAITYKANALKSQGGDPINVTNSSYIIFYHFFYYYFFLNLFF